MDSFFLYKPRLRKFVTESITPFASYFVLRGSGEMKNIFSFFPIYLQLKYKKIRGSKF